MKEGVFEQSTFVVLYIPESTHHKLLELSVSSKTLQL